jgi:hypothetical protein
MAGGRAAGGDVTSGEIGGMGGVELGGARVHGCRRIREEGGDWRFQICDSRMATDMEIVENRGWRG